MSISWMDGIYKWEPTPIVTGVYFFLTENTIVYVGQSVNLHQRVMQHLSADGGPIPHDVRDKVSVCFLKTGDLHETARRDLEDAFIHCYCPIYNRGHKQGTYHRYNGLLEEDLKRRLIQGTIPRKRVKLYEYGKGKTAIWRVSQES